MHFDNYNLHCVISIHALLAESDFHLYDSSCIDFAISIHALLAESDCQWRRSVKLFRQFLSTLSLRRATGIIGIINNVINDFYPRSPCGERLACLRLLVMSTPISIHALLAESD